MNKYIEFHGKQYECKRYGYDELAKMFDGAYVVITDVEKIYSDIVSGVLVDVCDQDRRDEIQLKYFIADGHYAFLDFKPMPLLAGYWGAV